MNIQNQDSYLWSDVATYSLQKNLMTDQTEFTASTRDGRIFEGAFYPDMYGVPMSAEELIVENIKQQLRGEHP